MTDTAGPPPVRLPPRVALVVGGSSGIGRATALGLQTAGRQVAVLSRAGTAPPGCLAVGADVTRADQVEAAFARVEKNLGPVEVLVSCVGATDDAMLARQSESSMMRLLEVNLLAAHRVARRALPSMGRNGWGRVVFLSSIAAVVGVAGQSGYGAAKAALIGLTHGLARESAARNVTVNVVLPGFVETSMTADVPAPVRDRFRAGIALGRFGRSHEVASAVVFLAGEQAGYITGASISVDGGQGMGR